MLAIKGLFSRPGIFNKMSRIFELQSLVSFVSAWTQHYMPLPHKPRLANQTIIVILIFCYFFVILIPIVILVSTTIGITIWIAITITMRITIGIWIRISVGINNKNNNRRKSNNRNNNNRIYNNNKYNNMNNNIKKSNDIRSHCCWKTGQTDTWTDPYHVLRSHYRVMETKGSLESL
jgi:hypothetical protein